MQEGQGNLSGLFIHWRVVSETSRPSNPSQSPHRNNSDHDCEADEYCRENTHVAADKAIRVPSRRSFVTRNASGKPHGIFKSGLFNVDRSSKLLTERHCKDDSCWRGPAKKQKRLRPSTVPLEWRFEWAACCRSCISTLSIYGTAIAITVSLDSPLNYARLAAVGNPQGNE